MPPTVFICYRREDAGYAAALSTALALRHGPDRVFKDITSLPLARDWQMEVTAAIGRSTHVLALIGPHWMTGVDPDGQRGGRADPIAFELGEAFRTQRTIVPVLLGGQRMPPAHHLPYALQRLPDLNAAYIRTESADADIATLVDRLPQSAPVRERPRSSGTIPPPRPPARSGCGRLVVGVVALLVLGWVAVVGITEWHKSSGTAAESPGGDAAVPTIAASDNPVPTKRVLTLTPRSGTAKTVVKATATGFTPGTQVDFWFQHVTHLGEDTVGSDGSVSRSFTVPSTYARSPDDWEVSVSERDSPGNYASAWFTLNA